jgi:hypothetical protein
MPSFPPVSLREAWPPKLFISGLFDLDSGAPASLFKRTISESSRLGIGFAITGLLLLAIFLFVIFYKMRLRHQHGSKDGDIVRLGFGRVWLGILPPKEVGDGKDKTDNDGEQKKE